MKLEDFDGTIRDEEGLAWNADKTARRPQLDKHTWRGDTTFDFFKTDIGFVFKTHEPEAEPDQWLVKDYSVIGGRQFFYTRYDVSLRVLDLVERDGLYKLARPIQVLMTQRDRTEALMADMAGQLGIEKWSDAFFEYVAKAEGGRRPDGAAWHYEAMSRALSDLARYCAVKSAQVGVVDAVRSLGEFSRDSEPDVPFFTEAGLYDLIGKDDARSVLARVRQIKSCAGA